jgi:hypothetical protein
MTSVQAVLAQLRTLGSGQAGLLACLVLSVGTFSESVRDVHMLKAYSRYNNDGENIYRVQLRAQTWQQAATTQPRMLSRQAKPKSNAERRNVGLRTAP